MSLPYWLTIAAKNGEVEAIQQLVRLGGNLDSKGFSGTPLECAATSGDPATARWLLEAGAKLTPDALANAARSDSVGVLKLFVEHGADLNTTIGGANLTLVNMAQQGDAKTAETFLREQGVSAVGDNSEPPEVPASRGPASKADLRRVETALSVKLPKRLLEFLLSPPDDVLWDAGVVEGLTTNADEIIKQTNAAREFKEEDWDESFPHNMIVIGGNGGGDLFCMKSGGRGPRVYLFEHETGMVSKDRITLDELIEEMAE